MPRVYFYHRWNARRHGARDARLNFPPPGEPVAGYLGELQSAVETHLEDEAQALTERHRRLDHQIQTRKERKSLEATKLQEAEAVWQDRGRKQAFSPLMHWFFLFLLLVGDISINELAFRPLEAQPVPTMLMTLLVCGVVVILAHFCGRVLKRTDRSGTENTLLALAIVGAIGISLAVGVARSQYIESKKSATPVVASRSITPSRQAPSPTRREDSDKCMWIFIVVQLAAFVAGTLTAYASSDPLEEQRRRSAKATARHQHALSDHRRAWETRRGRAHQWGSTGRLVEASYIGENVRRRAGKVTQSQLSHINPVMPQIFLTYPAPPDATTEAPAKLHLNGHAGREEWTVIPVKVEAEK